MTSLTAVEPHSESPHRPHDVCSSARAAGAAERPTHLGGRSVREGRWERPAEPALTVDPIAARMLLPHEINRLSDQSGRHLRWAGGWGAWMHSDMQGGSVDELLDVTIERPALDQLEVEVGRTLEDRVQSSLT